MEYEELIKERFSARKFKPIPVKQEDLYRILEAGRFAPSAIDRQPQKIYVLQSEEDLKKMDDFSNGRYGAMTSLLICGDTNIAYGEDGFSYALTDACIVITHMMLEATNIGVDNIWIGIADKVKARELFNLPDHIEPVAFLTLGYKTDECKPAGMHYKRKPLEETVIYR